MKELEFGPPKTLRVLIKTLNRLLRKAKGPKGPEKSAIYGNRIVFYGDSAMKVNGPGGIDLTPVNMHLETQNINGEWIKFHMDPVMLKQLQNARGFEPVIINIQPVLNLREFLGLSTA